MTKQCEFCEKEFEPSSQNRSKKNAQLFCGKRCQQKNWEDLNPRVNLPAFCTDLRRKLKQPVYDVVIRAIEAAVVKGRSRVNKQKDKETA